MNKKIVLLVSLIALLICGTLVGIFWDPIIDWLPIDQSGWDVLDNGGYCYLDEDGDPITGWQTLDGNTYYFDPDSYAMQIRWLELENRRYYLGDDGIRWTGWQTIGGKRYYLGNDGAMHTGWLDQLEGTMYLNEKGNPHTGWLELEDGTYYLNEAGFMYTGWLEQDGERRYLGSDGVMVTGWLELEEGTYYCGDDGIPMTGWQTVDEQVYYLNEAGLMQTGWLELEGERYYLCGDGTRYTGWLELGDNKYYMKEDGAAAKGKLVIEEQAYFFSSTGVNFLLVNTWNSLPEDFEPNLVNQSGVGNVAAECSDALAKMLEDCTAAGGRPDVIGGYRTISSQRVLFNNILQEYKDKGYGDAYARTLKRCAIPGTSEHHLGLAFDIVDPRYPQKYTGTNNAVAWLGEHCWEYGFILRYPADKTDITGIMSEPWHFRYVGVELAMELKDSGLCLEEYVDALTNDGTTCGNPDAKKAA